MSEAPKIAINLGYKRFPTPLSSKACLRYFARGTSRAKCHEIYKPRLQAVSHFVLQSTNKVDKATFPLCTHPIGCARWGSPSKSGGF